MVFDIFEDKIPLKIEKRENEYMDDDKKIISFNNTKGNKDKLN
jgi:hypothetical protein